MRIEAYAKVNLTLEVFGKRPDGYHALRSVVLPVSLADTLTVEPADALTSDTGYEDDLCLRAACQLQARIGRAPGASIRVEKRIPAGGGLGGGSADAAAVLVALNELWEAGLATEQLVELGAAVGSDVPALVLARSCGPVLMEGRGEKVSPIAVADRAFLSSLSLVLLAPAVASSTAEVFAKCGECVEAAPSGPTDAMAAALAAGDRAAVVAALSNDLKVPAVALYPEIGAALATLRAAGAAGVTMSGSGSTVFGLAANAGEAAAIAGRLNDDGFRAWAVHAA